MKEDEYLKGNPDLVCPKQKLQFASRSLKRVWWMLYPEHPVEEPETRQSVAVRAVLHLLASCLNKWEWVPFSS